MASPLIRCPFWTHVAIVWTVLAPTGCSIVMPPGCGGQRFCRWTIPVSAASTGGGACSIGLDAHAFGARDYDHCLAAGRRAENRGDARCVDWYYAAARYAWREAQQQPLGFGCEEIRARYNAALSELLRAAPRHGRLDASCRLIVQQGTLVREIPVVHQGFVWTATDFQLLRAPPVKREELLQRRYCRPGVGTPLVVERRRCDGDAVEHRFLPPKSWFSATAVLHFAEPASGGSSPADEPPAVLTFYDPLRISEATLAGVCQPLAGDLSAALAVALEEAPDTYLAGFIQPGARGVQARLSFAEPWQSNKIPVVFIHGLYSDPHSWADLFNDLRCDPVFLERYQLWFYRYPTGAGFLQSAARLREELRVAAALCPSTQSESPLHQMVLIGHSMGGLLAKTQVIHSEDRLWQRVARVPPEEIQTTPETRAMLQEWFFFEPLPEVRRVVFIASPHAGASAANRLVGRLASCAVHPSPDVEARHDQLIRDNPGAFTEFAVRRLPTTIDLLEPSSPLLEAMRETPVNCGAVLHNIIADGIPVGCQGPSDGVVPVSSAYHPGCESEMRLATTHTAVHRSTHTSAEILRILRLHLQASPAGELPMIQAPENHEPVPASESPGSSRGDPAEATPAPDSG